MTGNRLLIYSIALLLLPLLVAWWELSVIGAVVLVAMMLFWRHGITLSGILFPAKTADIELESISISHFVEKVRWCLDRLGVEYTERKAAGIIGVFFLGRMVPQLHIRTGNSRSTIGNSSDILRFLWGRYGAESGERAAFLEPDAERLSLERKIDRYGRDLQIWLYYHTLDNRTLSLRIWGRDDHEIAAWQRFLMSMMYPVLRAFLYKGFSISEQGYVEAKQRIDAFLTEMETCCNDGQHSITSGSEIDFIDISFAAISSVWVQPDGYGGGRADSVLIAPEDLPAGLITDQQEWCEKYPQVLAFVERMYREERQV